MSHPALDLELVVDLGQGITFIRLRMIFKVLAGLCKRGVGMIEPLLGVLGIDRVDKALTQLFFDIRDNNRNRFENRSALCLQPRRVKLKFTATKLRR